MKRLTAWWRRRQLVREIGLAAIELHRIRREYLQNLSAYKVGDKPYPTYRCDANVRATRRLSDLTDQILEKSNDPLT